MEFLGAESVLLVDRGEVAVGVGAISVVALVASR